MDTFKRCETPLRDLREVDCAPRGYAKSTIKALFKPIHDLCYGLEKYILLISCTEPQAIGKLKDIRRELLHNDLLIECFGIHFPTGRPGETEFIAASKEGETKFQALGSGSEIRGIRFGESRPTKIILDDVEDSEEVHNEELREKLKDWYFEVVRNLGSNGTNIEIVGTVLHRHSLLKTLEKNPAYSARIYKSVISWAERQDLWDQWKSIYSNLDNDNRLSDSRAFFEANKKEMLLGTKVLWPEKEPYLHLMEELVEIGKKAFMKEKQNQPMSGTDTLFDEFWWYREDAARGGFIIERTGAFIPYSELTPYGAMDPATGETKAKSKRKLDFTCILTGYHDLKGRLFVHHDFTKVVKPRVYIQQIFEAYDRFPYNKFVVETNLFRNLLLENLVRERKEREVERKKNGVKNWGLRIPFYEIENRDKKEKRITTLEPKVSNGYILFNRTLSVEFMNQMEEFPNAGHDDGPDTLEMLWGLVNCRYKPSPVDVDAMGRIL